MEAEQHRLDREAIYATITGKKHTIKCKLCRLELKKKRKSKFCCDGHRYTYHNLVHRFGQEKTDGLIDDLEKSNKLPEGIEHMGIRKPSGVEK